jgi:hypothetical protein
MNCRVDMASVYEGGPKWCKTHDATWKKDAPKCRAAMSAGDEVPLARDIALTRRVDHERPLP